MMTHPFTGPRSPLGSAFANLANLADIDLLPEDLAMLDQVAAA